MDAKLIDTLFSNEEEYFYCVLNENSFVYGGYFEDRALFDMLIVLYDTEPSARPDLIAFATEIMKHTDN